MKLRSLLLPALSALGLSALGLSQAACSSLSRPEAIQIRAEQQQPAAAPQPQPQRLPPVKLPSAQPAAPSGGG